MVTTLLLYRLSLSLYIVTGTAPEEAVVSKKTGHLFEKSVIEKYINQHGRCPITDQELTLDDLLPVQCVILFHQMLLGWTINNLFNIFSCFA